MAANTSTLADEDGEYNDWIEIHNAGTNLVDLGGYYLTDDARDLTRWRFPSTNLLADAYLVVFASSKDRSTPGKPLHTNFKLSQSGEYLALVRPDGVTVVQAFAPASQLANVSYGLGLMTEETMLIPTGAMARVLVPIDGSLGLTWTGPSFDDSTWTSGPTGVGFETNVSGFAVRYFEANVEVSNLSVAEQVIQNTNLQVRTLFTNVSAINFLGTGSSGHYANNSPFPGATTNTDVNNFVIEITALITIPSAGRWTFGVTSDEGFLLTVGSNSLSYPNLRQTGDTLDAFYFATPGEYPLRLLYFERTGSASLELYALNGNWPDWDSAGGGFRLLSDGVLSGLGVRPVYRSLIRTDIRSQMFRQNASAFIRIPFVVENPSLYNFLMLRMKYDDGFTAYLNGTEVTSSRAPPDLAWNSAALEDNSEADALAFEEFNLSDQRGFLQTGTNVLAIHGLNSASNNPNFLILPTLAGLRSTTQSNVYRYFTTPTPGAANGVGSAELGPILADLNYAPALPLDDQDIVVTTRIVPTFAPLASATLRYRVMYTNEVSLPLLDDGLHGDGLAGDGIYGAIIPASESSAGQMVRWYVLATDTNNRVARLPEFSNPFDSPEYAGTMISITSTSSLPTLYWFVQNPNAANADPGTRCSLFYNGELYDNIGVRIRGQAARGYPKKSYKFDFNSGQHFSFDPELERVEEIDVNTTYADKSFVRITLAWESFRDAGTPGSIAFPLRIQQNNAFFSVATFVEQPDERWLRRVGLDPNGALYKMFNSLEGASGNEKKTRQHENNSDLQALVAGIQPDNTNRVRYLFDNVNIAAMINYLAVMIVIHDNDAPHKNYFMYRDTEGTGEWQMTPWDKDLCLGRNWNSGLSDEIWATYDIVAGQPNISPSHPFFGDQRHQKIDAQWNRIIETMYTTPAVLEMYQRRLRTVTEQLLQPPGTAASQLKYERRINELYNAMQPDVALDRAKWPYGYGAQQDFVTGLNGIRTNYLPARRTHLFSTHSVTNSSYERCARLPPSQPSDAAIDFGAIEYAPASGNQAEEYIQLLNPNSFAVDMSGWQLTGAVEHTFQPGVVMPGNSAMYVSPDVKAFRARTTGPRGGQTNFVQGNYKGQLSARGETLVLVDTSGRTVSSTTYTGAPSPAQLYLRITEIMYHPPNPPGLSAYLDEEFEYIELKNIGPAALDLNGVHFTNGIEFAFSAGSVTNLGLGQSVLIVKNLAAFTSRYSAGSAGIIAGQYGGSLDNSGENLRLDDAVGDKILDFDYDNDWYPITDGHGFSLVIVDENAPWQTWREKSSWRPSGVEGGTPGESDPLPVAVAPILINELLSNSDAPQLDAIELYNPTTNDVNVGGWFITDDLGTPRKFRIANDTVILARGYLVFDERQFNLNPGVPPSFAFSSLGDEVYLFSADSRTNLTGYFHGFAFGPAENGVSFGRHVTSVGAEHFAAQRATTLGGPNAGPKVGPLVLNEIMYHPPDLADNLDNQSDEYLELVNISGASLSLYDPVFLTNTWQLRNAVEFAFPTSLTVPPNGHLLVVSFDPTNAPLLAAFRNKYGLSTNVTVLGPYRGKLDNAGESLELYKPDPRDGGIVPYILVDQVEYMDSAPWPTAADGVGASLQRKIASEYGNDPVNWVAAFATPARQYPGGTPPTITAQPTNLTAIAHMDVTLSVTAGPLASDLHYQWRFNGRNLVNATNPVLILRNVQPEQAGDYMAVVLNSAGSADTANAHLTVLIPATILAQPEERVVHPYQSVTFTVWASSSTPITYQWRFNGSNIPGATNSIFTIPSVQPSDAGNYTAIVADGVGPLVSDVARLTVLLHPTIVTQPRSSAVYPGSNVLFNVSATSSTPLTYQWRLNDSNIVDATNAVLAFTNMQASHEGIYSVAVSDGFGSILSDPASLTLLFNPVITQQPQSQTVFVGDTVVFSVTVTGTPPMGFLWRRSGTVVVPFGQGAPTLTLTNVQLASAGNYSLVVTNAGNSTRPLVSTSAVLIVLVDNDGDRMWDVWETAYGLNPTNRNDAALDPDSDGMTSLQEYIAGTNPLDQRSVLKLDPPGLSINSASFLSFIARSNKSYTLEWKESPEAGKWAKMADVPARTNEHVEILTDPYPLAQGRLYRLVTPQTPGPISAGPVILSSPRSQIGDFGQASTFSVIASGREPLRYQWAFSNALTLQALNASAADLVLTNTQFSDQGGYVVTVSDSQGATETSGPAVLALRPRLVAHPQSQSATVGQSVRFQVEGDGNSPLHYLWRRNKRLLTGQTNAVLILDNIQTNDAGIYSALVSHLTPFGQLGVVSSNAVLTVEP